MEYKDKTNLQIFEKESPGECCLGDLVGEKWLVQ